MERKSREQIFRDLLKEDKINMDLLRREAFGGVPDSGDLRCICWELLLGYLPPDRTLWKETLDQQRKLYESLRSIFLAPPEIQRQLANAGRRAAAVALSEEEEKAKAGTPGEKKEEDEGRNSDEAKEGEGKEGEKGEEKRLEDSVGDIDAWKENNKNDETLEIIEKDIARTLPSFHFYRTETEEGRTHSETLKIILFVFSKYNKAIGYVQGMNEILAPIYYVLLTQSREPQFAEHDSFFCFWNLMTEIGGCFCRQNDDDMLSTHYEIGKYRALLAILDRELFLHLYRLKVDPRFYALRWISLLFCQEFELPDVLRLWDSFFADEKRFEFVIFFSVAYLRQKRDIILKSDFATCLSTIQSVPDVIDISPLIREAQKMRKEAGEDVLKPQNLSAGLEEAIAWGKKNPPRKPKPQHGADANPPPQNNAGDHRFLQRLRNAFDKN